MVANASSGFRGVLVEHRRRAVRRDPFRPALGKRFYSLWLGESFAQAGTALMEFALGVWAYKYTGSALAFANVVVAALLPSILFLPLAGGLADRIGRKQIIVATDVTTALMILFLTLLSWTGHLRPMHLYIFNAVTSVIGSFRQPAYQAAVSTIVDKSKYTRVNGLISISKMTCTLMAPLVAGFVMAASGLATILVIDLTTFCLGIVFVLQAFSRLTFSPAVQPGATERNSPHLLRDLLRNVSDAVAYFRTGRLMLALLLYTMVRNALLALATLMMTPLVLASGGSQALGVIYTAASLGGFAGAALLISMQAPRHLMVLIIAADMVLSACMVSTGFARTTPLYCSLTFVAIAAACVADGGSQAIWMRKIPNRRKSSILSLITMTTVAAKASVLLGGGIIVDRLFEPALAVNGFLAHSIGTWLGVGKGRGVALLFIVSGLVGILASLCACSYSRMRHLDELVPDEKEIKHPDARFDLLPAGNPEAA